MIHAIEYTKIDLSNLSLSDSVVFHSHVAWAGRVMAATHRVFAHLSSPSGHLQTKTVKEGLQRHARLHKLVGTLGPPEP